VKRYKADLHIHSALSPCALEEMTPPAIVAEAARKGLHMIGICDHNSAGNAAAVQEAAGTFIAAIAGMEITTVEDIHVVGLFPNSASARAAAGEVLAGLPPLTDRSKRFGEQLLMNAQGRVIGKEPKMLAASSTFNLSETVKLIKRHNGLALAAHVNRPSFSVISQLGFFPPDVDFDAVEILVTPYSALPAEEQFRGLSMLNSSDSHFLSDIGACFTIFEMADPTFEELTLALKGIDGRSCSCA
jgi:hypothetical protein